MLVEEGVRSVGGDGGPRLRGAQVRRGAGGGRGLLQVHEVLPEAGQSVQGVLQELGGLQGRDRGRWHVGYGRRVPLLLQLGHRLLQYLGLQLGGDVGLGQAWDRQRLLLLLLVMVVVGFLALFPALRVAFLLLFGGHS